MGSFVLYCYFFCIMPLLSGLYVCPTILVNSCRILVPLKTVLKQVYDLGFLKNYVKMPLKYSFEHMVHNMKVLMLRFLRQKAKSYVR